MQVEQIDREAAVNAVDAVVSDGFVVGCCVMDAVDGHEFAAYITEAFARHRHQARAEVVGEIVAWLEEMYENCESIDGMLTRMDSKDELANMMQAKFGGRDGNE